MAPSGNLVTHENSAPDSSFRRLNKHLHMSVSTLNIRAEEWNRAAGELAVVAVAGHHNDIENQH